MGNSKDENPVYTYIVNGAYTIVLMVTDGLLSEQTETKADCLMAYKIGDANVHRIIDMSDVTKIERIILGLD
jgi:PKD repeat protein